MKRGLLAIALLLCVTSVMAIPAKPGVWKTIRLADGSELRAELHGDEFGSFWTSEDGRHYVEIAGSDLYREVELSEVIAKAEAKRAEERKMEQRAQSTQNTQSIQRRIPGGAKQEYQGEKRGLIILVNFANSKFSSIHDVEYYERLTNEENFTDNEGNTHSVRDYYLDQSYGQFDLSFDIAGPIELQYDDSYYGYNNESHRVYMVQEACDGAYAAGVDFSKYDWDGDGMVEQVFILYAGYGAADTGNYTYVWPHKSTITKRTYGDVSVSVYACSCELARTGNSNGIGCICHEFSHCMGLMDVYDTYGTGNFGMGTWSILSMGCYNGNGYGYMPAGYTSYERACCGWLTPIELTEETSVTDMKGLSEGGEAYIIYNKGTSNEFFMLENRTLNGFDSELANDGMLIVQIDYNAYYWTNNVINSNYLGNTHQRYTIIPADNVQSSATETKDTWPNSGRNHLDNYTTPSGETYNANNDGNYYMNVSIYDITKADDKTISFKFLPEGKSPIEDTTPEGAIFYESFNSCMGIGGNDDDFSNSGEADDFYPDNEGWTCSTAYGAYQCAFFGSNRQAANLTTPTFTISGAATLSFRAAPFTALVPATVEISSETEGITLSETEISLPQGEWTDFSITLYGEGDVQLRMKETTGINRFYLDEVVVMPAEVSDGISSIHADDVTRQGIYSTSGQQVNVPQTGVNIMRYTDGTTKKVLVR